MGYQASRVSLSPCISRWQLASPTQLRLFAKADRVWPLLVTAKLGYAAFSTTNIKLDSNKITGQ